LIFLSSRIFIFLFSLLLFSCGYHQKLARSAKNNVIQSPVLRMAHVGISVYEPATGRYWYNYQGDKYFVPASNVKIPTCYAALKYLGDSLVGLQYGIPEEKYSQANLVIIRPTGDPTFLHRDFFHHQAFAYLQEKILEEHSKPLFLIDTLTVERWGSGWSWNDYEAAYMAERSSMPIFGNTVRIGLRDSAERYAEHPYLPGEKLSRPFYTGSGYFDSILNSRLIPGLAISERPFISISRDIDQNRFLMDKGSSPFNELVMPFVTRDSETAIDILQDSLKRRFEIIFPTSGKDRFFWDVENGDAVFITIKEWKKLYSHPLDSLLKPMMHRSDNFFAEQCLLMASNEKLGLMNEHRIIGSLLQTELKGLPQKPRWVDGSGLSRYNLFSPQDFVYILDKMQNEFGMERIRNIFPGANEGTLSNYYVGSEGRLFAKTGTLSGVVALSGFLTTNKNKQLIFSVLVNNHQASGTEVRRAVERFVVELMEEN
jgi:D-alanyl-D-alanine carboxypeptidase/D-alanyl-D-alanine-endopeptidase (penicillin-binding protein 4)